MSQTVREKAHEDIIKFVLAKKYGQWRALYVIEYNPAFLGKETYWCRCDCGHEQKIQHTLLKDKFRSPRCRNCYTYKK